MLDDDALDHLGDVLALVDRVFQESVNVLPLEDINRLRAVIEEARNGRPLEPVSFVLQPMDLDHEAVEILETAQVAECLVELLAAQDDQRGLLDGGLGRRSDVVEHERVGDLFDEIEDVVQAADQGVDLLAVERRDEGCFQAAADVVADVVPAMLGVADLLGRLVRAVEGAQHRLELPSAVQDVGCVFDEKVEEAFVARDQSKRRHFYLRMVAAGSTGRSGEGACCRDLSLIHISEPTRLGMISYAVFCLKKKKKKPQKTTTHSRTKD